MRDVDRDAVVADRHRRQLVVAAGRTGRGTTKSGLRVHRIDGGARDYGAGRVGNAPADVHGHLLRLHRQHAEHEDGKAEELQLLGHGRPRLAKMALPPNKK